MPPSKVCDSDRSVEVASVRGSMTHIEFGPKNKRPRQSFALGQRYPREIHYLGIVSRPAMRYPRLPVAVARCARICLVGSKSGAVPSPNETKFANFASPTI